MEELLAFIKRQQLLAISAHDGKDIWLANVYFAADEEGNIYFVSSTKAKHSQLMLENSHIAFSTAWFDPNNLQNRKSVQGLGVCRPASNAVEIALGIKLLFNKFPDLRDTLTVKWIMTNIWSSKIWIIKPDFMKYWDDEIYGDEESKEFSADDIISLRR